MLFFSLFFGQYLFSIHSACSKSFYSYSNGFSDCNRPWFCLSHEEIKKKEVHFVYSFNVWRVNEEKVSTCISAGSLTVNMQRHAFKLRNFFLKRTWVVTRQRKPLPQRPPKIMTCHLLINVTSVINSKLLLYKRNQTCLGISALRLATSHIIIL